MVAWASIDFSNENIFFLKYVNNKICDKIGSFESYSAFDIWILNSDRKLRIIEQRTKTKFYPFYFNQVSYISYITNECSVKTFIQKWIKPRETIFSIFKDCRRFSNIIFMKLSILHRNINISSKLLLEDIVTQNAKMSESQRLDKILPLFKFKDFYFCFEGNSIKYLLECNCLQISWKLVLHWKKEKNCRWICSGQLLY